MRDSGKLLQLIHRGLVNAGVDVDAIYRRLGYDARTLPLHDQRPRHNLQSYFWRTVESVTGDREIGLHICPHLPVFRGEILEYLFLSSLNFGEGLRSALRYRRLISDSFRARLDNDNDGVRIALRGTEGDASELRHPEICFVYEFLQIMNAVTDGGVWPTHINLCCEPRVDKAEFEAVFECPVGFGHQESEIWLESAVLDMKSAHRDQDMFDLHREHADAKLMQLQQQDITDRVYDHLLGLLDFDNPADAERFTLHTVAHELGMPARSLRRALANAGTSFRAICKQARFSFARQLLRSTSETLEDIAVAVGFSEPSAFCRAFKDWAGIAPSSYRERHQKPHESSAQVIQGDFRQQA